MKAFHAALIYDLSSEEGFPLPQGMHLRISALRGRPLNTSPEIQVQDLFEGGETVTAKVFDREGRE